MSTQIIIPPRTDPPPIIRRDRQHRIIWEPSLIALLRSESLTGRSCIQTAKWLGLTKNSVYDVSKRLEIKWPKPQYFRKKKTEDLEVEFNPVHRDRQRAGADPLPPGHSISWGAISEYCYG